MTEFLLELYVAKTAGADVEGLAMRARAAADGLAAEGRPMRCACSILVPEDETCFLLFEAGVADDVREAAERADLPFGRISAAVADRAGEATTVVPARSRSTYTG
jgi:hypothetical protein